MLNYLKIKNLALIENAEVEFAPGFNVVTGESGSGKTVLLNTQLLTCFLLNQYDCAAYRQAGG